MVEIGGGTSTTPFQWHVVCNRADDVSSAGASVSKYADLRFEPAPVRPEHVTLAKPQVPPIAPGAGAGGNRKG